MFLKFKGSFIKRIHLESIRRREICYLSRLCTQAIWHKYSSKRGLLNFAAQRAFCARDRAWRIYLQRKGIFLAEYISVCKVVFPYTYANINMIKSLDSSNSSVIWTSSIYICSECSYTETVYELFQMHLLVSHRHLKDKYVCESCGIVFESFKNLSKHNEKDHQIAITFCEFKHGKKKFKLPIRENKTAPKRVSGCLDLSANLPYLDLLNGNSAVASARTVSSSSAYYSTFSIEPDHQNMVNSNEKICFNVIPISWINNFRAPSWCYTIYSNEQQEESSALTREIFDSERCDRTTNATRKKRVPLHTFRCGYLLCVQVACIF
uniref:C2H2-type domain-containing protein n=1 Tax=Trichogramma kaykai TaxID=54128 RepID=A0ABD2WMW3_9HYME